MVNIMVEVRFGWINEPRRQNVICAEASCWRWKIDYTQLQCPVKTTLRIAFIRNPDVPNVYVKNPSLIYLPERATCYLKKGNKYFTKLLKRIYLVLIFLENK